MAASRKLIQNFLAGIIDYEASGLSESGAGGGGAGEVLGTYDLSVGGLTEIEIVGLDAYSAVDLIMMNAAKSVSAFDEVRFGDAQGYDTEYMFTQVNAATDTGVATTRFNHSTPYSTGGFWFMSFSNVNLAAPTMFIGAEQFSSAPFFMAGYTVAAKIHDRLKVTAQGTYSAGTLYAVGK